MFISCKKPLVLILILFFSLLGTKTSQACVGARPMGMGGAFIAVADDVNTIYWNPAGLTLLEDIQLTYTRTMNSRGDINYDDYLGFANKAPDLPIGYALGYIGVRQYAFIGFIPPNTPVYFEYEKPQFYASLGYQVSHNLSLGGTIRRSTITNTFTAPGYLPDRDSFDAMELDVGGLFRSDNGLSIGLLIQNINTPEYPLFNGEFTYKMARNIRGGIAYRFSHSFVVAIDRYDLLNEASLTNPYMFGLEGTFSHISLRVGSYLGSYKTLGWGYEAQQFSINHTMLISDNYETVHLLGTLIRF